MKTLALLLALTITSTGFSQLISTQTAVQADATQQEAVKADDLSVIPFAALTDEHKQVIKEYEDSVKEKTFPVVSDKLREYVKANPRLAPYFLEIAIKEYPRNVVALYSTALALVPSQRVALQTVAVSQVPSSRFQIFSVTSQANPVIESVDTTIASPSS